jgi:hypothetical protein
LLARCDFFFQIKINFSIQTKIKSYHLLKLKLPPPPQPPQAQAAGVKPGEQPGAPPGQSQGGQGPPPYCNSFNANTLRVKKN